MTGWVEKEVNFPRGKKTTSKVGNVSHSDLFHVLLLLTGLGRQENGQAPTRFSMGEDGWQRSVPG